MITNVGGVKVVRKKPRVNDVIDEIELPKASHKTRHQSIQEQLAESTFCYLNFTVMQLKATFFQDRDMFHVDYYYPYAKGGPLYIDRPRFPQQIDMCALKKVAMKEQGLRYIYITPQMNITDCLLELDRK